MGHLEKIIIEDNNLGADISMSNATAFKLTGKSIVTIDIEVTNASGSAVGKFKFKAKAIDDLSWNDIGDHQGNIEQAVASGTDLRSTHTFVYPGVFRLGVEYERTSGGGDANTVANVAIRKAH